MRFHPALLLASLMAWTAPAAADFERGVSHFKNGDVEGAVAEWKESAAEGHPMAAFLLGNLYMQGRGVTQSDEIAFSYFTQAAEAGNSDAQVRVAEYYMTGIDSLDLERDYGKALEWLDKAALRLNAQAQYYLGVMNREGRGVTRDRAEGLRWLLLAAKKGHVPSFIELSEIYAKGEGVTEDPVEGAMYLALAKRFGSDAERQQANEMQDKLRNVIDESTRLQGEARANKWLEARQG